MFTRMHLYFTAVLWCFPILCYLPAWLTMCISMILLLFRAWGAVSSSRIVEDNDKEAEVRYALVTDKDLLLKKQDFLLTQ